MARGVTVEEHACFGRCRHGPNAAVERGGSEVMLSGLKTLQDNMGAIKRATGKTIAADARLLTRLQVLRKVTELESALTDVQMELEVLDCSPSNLSSRSGLAKLDGLLKRVDGVIARCGEAHPLVLARTVRRKLVALRQGRPVSPSTEDALDEDPEYKVACWRIEAIEPVSQHSAIFRLSSGDTARGRAIGKYGQQRIWHVALHVERDDGQGGGDDSGDYEDEEEGRVVLREYTPISTDAAWEGGATAERGECALLVKIYPDGRATQWLRARAVGESVWLSPPRTTLEFPTLRPPEALSDAPPVEAVDFSSVVLLAGGTGIAPLWQALRGGMCDADARLAALPLTLVYSCRRDDILLAQPLSECIAARAGSRAIVAVTEDVGSGGGPPAYAHVALTALADLRERFRALTFTAGRVSEALLREVLAERPSPRVVVSGPEGFMDHVGGLLRQLGVPRQAVVCLRA